MTLFLKNGKLEISSVYADDGFGALIEISIEEFERADAQGFL